MRKLIITLLMICVYSTVYAQQLTIKSVNMRPQDARARTNPRDDGNGKKCAIIRVGVVGVENLVFPDAVGNVDRSLSEYVVYVPEGLKTLRYNNKEGKNLGVIKFDDWDQEINSLASYDVIFESSDHLRSAIFSIQPANATLVFDGKRVEVNKNGMAMINKPVGEYSYKVEVKGFLSQQGKVTLEEDDISTVTDVVLEEQLYPVSIKVVPDNATVFIDNVPYTKASLSDLKLSEGTHAVRVTAENYKDEERSIKVGPLMVPESFTLKAAKQVVVKHKEERSRTNTSVRSAVYYSIAGEMYDKNKYNSFDFGGKAGLNFLHPFGGVFSLKWGGEFGIMHMDKELKFKLNEELNDSTSSTTFFEVPIQLGFSIPFGRYNRHMFSVLGGGYYRWTWLRTNEVIGYDSKNNEDKFSHFSVHDYGLRLTAMVDFQCVGISGEVSKSLNNHGLYFGVKIAYKMPFGSTSSY